VAAPGAKQGLGTSIVEALAHQLDAQVDRQSTGSGFSVSVVRERLSQPLKQRDTVVPIGIPQPGVSREMKALRQVSMSW
jgi:two-component sensor histidine kinase